jgi:hypothetical protein
MTGIVNIDYHLKNSHFDRLSNLFVIYNRSIPEGKSSKEHKSRHLEYNLLGKKSTEKYYNQDKL